MRIMTVDVTNEQLAIINKKATTEAFGDAIETCVVGLINWYLDEGRQIIEAENKVETVARSVLIEKLDEVKLAQVDAIIGYINGKIDEGV